ncbi:hypothetical protein CCZ01_09070 [Helicobacter monodelphidis]|uniref:recombinase family protein n=1 Tax=Helicobacter sp. 15-1451 TaxID=2004995 RepID=UPI000DCAEBCF|nr:recombinase family protein [Helicobacter sp. 15-1451]RAX56590.1 hypothetical protein CCZ01_09070 [Helicobacter sp. 15-1451]
MNLAYLRVSTHKQSIDSQRLAIYNYCQQHKIQIDEFIEVEISSQKSREQRRIQELIDKLQKGDLLIITELSRLERGTLEAMQLILALTKKGVEIIFINQPQLSTNQPTVIRELLTAIYSFIDQSERERISERTKAGLEAAKAKGKLLGRPKGVRGKSMYDEDTQKIIHYIKQGILISQIWKLIGKKGSYHAFWNFCKRTPEIQRAFQEK